MSTVFLQARQSEDSGRGGDVCPGKAPLDPALVTTADSPCECLGSTLQKYTAIGSLTTEKNGDLKKIFRVIIQAFQVILNCLPGAKISKLILD